MAAYILIVLCVLNIVRRDLLGGLRWACTDRRCPSPPSSLSSPLAPLSPQIVGVALIFIAIFLPNDRYVIPHILQWTFALLAFCFPWFGIVGAWKCLLPALICVRRCPKSLETHQVR